MPPESKKMSEKAKEALSHGARIRYYKRADTDRLMEKVKDTAQLIKLAVENQYHLSPAQQYLLHSYVESVSVNMISIKGLLDYTLEKKSK